MASERSESMNFFAVLSGIALLLQKWRFEFSRPVPVEASLRIRAAKLPLLAARRGKMKAKIMLGVVVTLLAAAFGVMAASDAPQPICRPTDHVPCPSVK